jgi:CRP-like cAMP-binding protein
VEQGFWPKARAGDLVAYLTDDEHRRLRAAMEPCTARGGDVILHKGSPSRSLLLVEEGEIEVVDDAMGQALVLGRVGPGGIVGEVGFVDGKPRTHHVRALVDCRLRRLGREALLKLAETDAAVFAKVTLALAQVLAVRYRSAMAELQPVRSFAASLREPLQADPQDSSGAEFAELDAPLPGETPLSGTGSLPPTAVAGDDSEATHALDVLKEVARRAIQGRTGNPGV